MFYLILNYVCQYLLCELTIVLHMHLLCRHEFKQNHGEWIKTVKPSLDPTVSSQVREVTAKEVENCQAVRNEMRATLDLLLKV